MNWVATVTHLVSGLMDHAGSYSPGRCMLYWENLGRRSQRMGIKASWRGDIKVEVDG